MLDFLLRRQAKNRLKAKFLKYSKDKDLWPKLRPGERMNDDDIDLHEDEFLMSTRQRRANAGNKMRRLLEQELEDMQSKTEQLEEDEVDLLFQEDADDEEFEAEESSNGEQPERTMNAEPEGDEDEMFSESEDESGDQNEDNEEGERDLQRQEKFKSRKLKKKKTPAVIKRKHPKPDDDYARKEQEAKKKAHYELIKAENLLISNRRTSKRSSVVANKMKVYEKLSKAEKKRKMIQDRIKKHKEAQREEILTQEDRVRIALETEKFNILSLDKFKEQEVSKKQSRIALQQRQKLKFKQGEIVIRQLSCSWYVTPVTELQDAKYWEEQLKRREKKKKKYTRRPYKKHKQEAKKENTELKIEEEAYKKVPTVEEANEKNEGVQMPVQGANNNKKVETLSEEKLEPQPSEVQINGEERKHALSDENKSEVITEGLQNLADSKNADGEFYKELKASTDSPDESEIVYGEAENHLSDPQSAKNRSITPQPTNNEIKTADNEAVSSVVTKQVTFAEETQVTVIDSSGDIPPPAAVLNETGRLDTPDLMDDVGSEEEQMYEGPDQLVGKNFVTVYSFPRDTHRDDIHRELFGENWENGLNSRSSDVETICKLTMPEEKNDYLQTTSLTANLSFLNNFPAFGEYDKKVVHDTDATSSKEFEIEIKTPPPTGVFLPNGLRKKCLISSKECQYFDPKNGVPYSDVEAYKTIQELQNPIGNGTEEEPQPHFQWFGFGNGGIYLNISHKPAKGVPDGF